MREKKWFKISTVVCVALILLSLIVYVLQNVQIFLVLNGEKDMTIPVLSSFDDPGARNRLTGGVVVGTGDVDTTRPGDYEVEYSAMLQKITRTVHVVDDQAPSLILNGPSYKQIPVGTQLSTQGVVALDNFDQNVEVVLSQGIPDGQPGEYDVVYTAQDSSGNIGETHQTVRVVSDDFHYENQVANNVSLVQTRVDKIVAFLNEYYRSMKYLEASDMTGFFGKGGEVYAYKFQKGLEYLIATRKLSHNSLYLDDCSYDIVIDRTDYAGDGLCVTVHEDSTVKFHFLGGEESKQHAVLSRFYFNYDGEIVQVYREEGFYLASGDEDTEFGADYREVIDKSYEEYLKAYVDELDISMGELTAFNRGEAGSATKTAANPYDRNAAADYADRFALVRNWQYSDYESNCMNYMSQIIHAGGIPFDYTGSNQWKNYSMTEDHSDAEQGFTYEFIRISYFQNYITDTADPSRMVVEQGLNFWLGEKGDIVYVGMDSSDYSEFGHVVAIAAPVYDSEGNLVDFLVNGNTNDQYHYPLSASPYVYRRLGKVLGYNN